MTLSRTERTATARDAFRRWTDCLLSPHSTPGEQREVCQEWCRWGLGLLGVESNGADSTMGAFAADSILPTGKAISPLGAARCVWEYRRTAVFLRAMDQALRVTMDRFPGETLHVMEAGCGPLAPLVLPFALRHPPSRVQFSLLDLHPIALDGARRIAEELGLTDSVRAYIAADATAITLAKDDRPHLIACEVLLRALTREPQVAATLNLAPQLRRGGIFLPERIEVDAVLYDGGKHQQLAMAGIGGSAMTELGPVFVLDAGALDQVVHRDAAHLQAATVRVPPHDETRMPLHLGTRIQVFGEHRLGDFESSLNLPERVRCPAGLAQGGELEFVYEIGADPRLRLTDARSGAVPPVGGVAAGRSGCGC